MLISSFYLSQSFNYTPHLFYKKTVQIREPFFLYMDLALGCLALSVKMLTLKNFDKKFY
jgi:hypothetical protein